jgi:hypothetical protein
MEIWAILNAIDFYFDLEDDRRYLQMIFYRLWDIK